MPRAARLTDPALPAHPGLLAAPGAPGLPVVLIEGLPAACKGDLFGCAFPPPGGPHAGSRIATGSATVRIGGRPAARMGDLTSCGAVIAGGAATVKIGD